MGLLRPESLSLSFPIYINSASVYIRLQSVQTSIMYISRFFKRSYAQSEITFAPEITFARGGRCRYVFPTIDLHEISILTVSDSNNCRGMSSET